LQNPENGFCAGERNSLPYKEKKIRFFARTGGKTRRARRSLSQSARTPHPYHPFQRILFDPETAGNGGEAVSAAKEFAEAGESKAHGAAHEARPPANADGQPCHISALASLRRPGCLEAVELLGRKPDGERMARASADESCGERPQHPRNPLLIGGVREFEDSSGGFLEPVVLFDGGSERGRVPPDDAGKPPCFIHQSFLVGSLSRHVMPSFHRAATPLDHPLAPRRIRKKEEAARAREGPARPPVAGTIQHIRALVK
jgi:hypothetical protein